MNISLEKENFYMLNWLDSYLVGHHGFICGGCFKNILQKEKVKDLDIFFRRPQDWEDACWYFDSKTAGYTEHPGDEPLSEEDATYYFYYENDKVKAYKNIKTGVAIELCCSVFGTPEEIINGFDFTITKFAYYNEEVEDEDGLDTHLEPRIICNDKFFEHLHMKRLVIDDRVDYPMSTLERVIRYAKYGYFPCRESKIKLAKAINELPPERIEVSESLYDGVD